MADPVNIKDSTYKLSTDIRYAIYETATNDYLIHVEAPYCPPNERCYPGADVFNHDVKDPKSDANYQWTIVNTQTGYALQNVGTKHYLSTYSSAPGSGGGEGEWYGEWVHMASAPSAYNDPYLSWRFENTGQNYQIAAQQTIPIVKIKRASNERALMSEESTRPCFPNSNGEPTAWNVEEKDCYKSSWVFIPLSLPLNCESITTDPSTPDAFKSLTSQIDSSSTNRFHNAGSTPASFSTPEREVCKEVTTTFTRTDGAEKTYGFSVEYESPDLSLGGLALGSFSAEYHMDWRYYSETTNTKENTESTCVTFPSTEVTCPPRTTCQRIVTTYKPPVGDIEFTITATCEGNQYTTKGIASVDGIVRIEYVDQMIPMDCKYYTTDYNIFKQGTLQFCDTCNNDKICEICRDGYILLDGVCITESTCENICGGEVRGGQVLEVLGGAGPWSGGSCRINNHVKYLSASCRKQLGGASTTQSNTTPSPSSAPTDNNNGGGSTECVNPWEQCGGIDYKGVTTCCNDGREYECQTNSEWWSQCNPK